MYQAPYSQLVFTLTGRAWENEQFLSLPSVCMHEAGLNDRLSVKRSVLSSQSAP